MERYPDLNYAYVLAAYRNGSKLYLEGLHDVERPIAQQSALIANQQRNPKKQSKPFTLSDFAIYKINDHDKPSGRYGAAAVWLVKQKLFPSWALFCFKDLADGASDGYEPTFPALIADDAILLHPTKVEGGYQGLLIAQESAGDRSIAFHTVQGEPVILMVPHIHTKVTAEEDVVLLRP